VQQLREAFADPCRYRYVILDRDSKFDAKVTGFLKAAGLEPKRTTRTASKAWWCERPDGRGEQKAKYATLLHVKQCRVSFKDSEGIEHAVELEARTLYEAVGLAIDRFRRCEHVKYDPKGLHVFTVESREPGTQHSLTRNSFDTWLRRPGRSPADVALKSRLTELLGGTPE
jgi:hypothetical protein